MHIGSPKTVRGRVLAYNGYFDALHSSYGPLHLCSEAKHPAPRRPAVELEAWTTTRPRRRRPDPHAGRARRAGGGSGAPASGRAQARSTTRHDFFDSPIRMSRRGPGDLGALWCTVALQAESRISETATEPRSVVGDHEVEGYHAVQHPIVQKFRC
jgi:hypothetical protein